MQLNSVSNCCIFVIEAFELLTQCHLPYGLFCSVIYEHLFAQLYKIVLSQFFNNCFRFMSNFTYVAFSINRISLIGKEHGLIITKLSEIRCRTYVGIVAVASLILSVVKIFTYAVNYTDPEVEYPIWILDNAGLRKKYDPYIAFVVFNMLVDLIDYMLFPCVNLATDIVLVRKLKVVLAEKLKKNFSEKLKKENEEAID